MGFKFNKEGSEEKIIIDGKSRKLEWQKPPHPRSNKKRKEKVWINIFQNSGNEPTPCSTSGRLIKKKSHLSSERSVNVVEFYLTEVPPPVPQFSSNCENSSVQMIPEGAHRPHSQRTCDLSYSDLSGGCMED